MFSMTIENIKIEEAIERVRKLLRDWGLDHNNLLVF